MSTPTREALQGRADVDNADIDDIIGVAFELQQESEDAQDRASVAEVEAVAQELDIAPQYVEQAIAVLGARREEAMDAARKEELQAGERRRKAGIVAGTVLAMLGAGLAGQLYLVNRAAAELNAYATEVHHSAEYLDVVLDRQAAVVPQLIALSGGDPAPLKVAVEAMRSADDVSARLEASRALDDALTQVLVALPPPADDTEAVQRLGLTHELTGIQNRRSTESRRYRDAVQSWESKTLAPGASWAIRLGWTEALP